METSSLSESIHDGFKCNDCVEVDGCRLQSSSSTQEKGATINPEKIYDIRQISWQLLHAILLMQDCRSLVLVT